MTIRVTVQLSWSSDLRKKLFQKLSKLGYRWSGGDDLSIPPKTAHNMQYISIYTNNKHVRYGSDVSCATKFIFKDEFFNFLVTRPTVDKIMNSIETVDILNNPKYSDYERGEFVKKHNSFIKRIL